MDLADLSVRCYRDAFGHCFSSADLDAHLGKFLTAEQFHRYIHQDAVLVAEMDRRLCGLLQFGAFRFHEGGEGRDCQEIRRLYVDPDSQGEGVGTVLMNAALADPRMVRDQDIVLDVWEHNHRARRFYERYGFRIVGTRSLELASGAESSLDLVMMLPANPWRSP